MSLKQKLRKNPIVTSVGFRFHKLIRTGAQRAYGRLCAPDPMKVVFTSFEGRQYSDNPRYVSEALHALCPEAKIVWMMRNARAPLPDYVIPTRFNSMDSLRHMATARVWVSNYRMYYYYVLDRSRQYYINTWHGDRGFKRIGYDDPDAACHRRGLLESQCAFMVSGSDFGSNLVHSSSHCDEAFCVGCPRNDILLRGDAALAASVRKKLGIPEDERVLLYAPTFRDTDMAKGTLQRCGLNLERVLNCLEKKTGEKWRCLFRTHQFSRGIRMANQEKFQNVTGWPEMAEMLLISDMLITDYSSCGSDYVLQNRPAIYFQDDLAEFEAINRQMYFDMKTSPFLIAHSQEELEALIARLTPEMVSENCRAIKAFYGEKETGHASELTARRIMEYLKPAGKP